MGRDPILRLHRGITVKPGDVEAVVASTRIKGLRGDEGGRVTAADVGAVRARFHQLRKERNTTCDILFQETVPGVFACGNPVGAKYYACKHNYYAKVGRTSPIVITFDAPLSHVYVDSRDFLCTAFQLWDQVSFARVDEQREVLATLFGGAVLPYFAEAAATKDQTRRIYLCNLAALDPAVVEAHYANDVLFTGRFRTTVKSAFVVQAPLAPGDIVNVYEPEGYDTPLPQMTLDLFLGR